MKDWKNKLWRCLTDEENGKYYHFMVIPFAVVLLIAVIIAADKSGGRKTAVNPLESTQEVSGSSAADISGGLMEPFVLEMQKDGVAEISKLVQEYLQARKDCDANALNQVFGNTFTDEKFTTEQAALNEETSYYEDFQNPACYTKQGLKEGEYIVYITFDIKFRQADTSAPTMIVCYAMKDTGGNYYFTEKLTGEAAEYIARMNQSDEVRLLSGKVNASLRNALEHDADLLRVYDELMGSDELQDLNQDESGLSPGDGEQP